MRQLALILPEVAMDDTSKGRRMISLAKRQFPFCRLLPSS